MYKTIMAPTEGSDSEKAAISVAVKLAQRFNAELHLVRVLAAPFVCETIVRPPALEMLEETLREERLACMRKLEGLGTECRVLGEIRVVTALEDGPVAPALRDYAKRFDVDLIVMSSHSRGGLKRIALGSVTDYLLRQTNVPVLVVKSPVSFIGATPEETAGRIVVPLDGSPLAEQILPEVAALALRLNSAVILLHVLTPETYSQRRIMQSGLPWWDRDVAAGEACLSRAAGSLREAGVAVSKDIVLSEDIATAILDYATRSRADLIAIATRGSGGMSRFVFGSVADKVTRKSSTALLVFHPKFPSTPATVGERSSAETLAGV